MPMTLPTVTVPVNRTVLHRLNEHKGAEPGAESHSRTVMVPSAHGPFSKILSQRKRPLDLL